MITQELLQRLTAMLEQYEERLADVEEGKRVATQQMRSTAYLHGQIDMLVSICAALEALVLEAVKP